MHLRFEKTTLSRFFTAGFILACSLYTIILTALGVKHLGPAASQPLGTLLRRGGRPMCMWRLDMDRLQELVRLHRMETGPCDVARLLGLSRTTERQYYCGACNYQWTELEDGSARPEPRERSRSRVD